MTFNTAFVTGANGFIAQHLVNQLLEKGYSVVGTVRSKDKGNALVKYFGSKFTYEIIENLEDEGVFEKTLENHPEVTVVFHTASPITFAVQDLNNDILVPAIEGTKNILKAIKQSAPQVKKVIYTSSGLSITDSNNPKAAVNEESWNTITLEQALTHPMLAYAASKKFAEEAAWDFTKIEKPNFKLTVVNPLLVLGPQLQDEYSKGSPNVTNTFLTNLLNVKEGEPIPEFSGRFINVKDVAKAHIIAAEKNADGKRIIVNGGEFDTQTALDLIHKNIPEISQKFVKGKPGQGVPDEAFVDDTKSREFLNFEYIGLKETISSTLKQFIEVNNL